MAKTHKEQDEEIKLLKNEVRRLREEIKSTEAEISGLGEQAPWHRTLLGRGHTTAFLEPVRTRGRLESTRELAP